MDFLTGGSTHSSPRVNVQNMNHGLFMQTLQPLPVSACKRKRFRRDGSVEVGMSFMSSVPVGWLPERLLGGHLVASNRKSSAVFYWKLPSPFLETEVAQTSMCIKCYPKNIPFEAPRSLSGDIFTIWFLRTNTVSEWLNRKAYWRHFPDVFAGHHDGPFRTFPPAFYCL